MSGHSEHYVDARGRRCRVWEKGEGRKIFWLASAPLLYHWTTIHEKLSENAHLIVCALPGMAGNGRNHEDLDDHLSWVSAARDLLVAAGFTVGDTLMGSSTAGALAADVAALWPDLVGRLILVAPHGIYDEANPTTDMYALHPRDAHGLLCVNPARFKDQIAPPADFEPILWGIEVYRSNEASARFLWPLSDTGVRKRLDRITAPTALIWGKADKIIPPGYADIFAAHIGAPVTIVQIDHAGHVAELDEPEAIADAVKAFLTSNSTAAAERAAA